MSPDKSVHIDTPSGFLNKVRKILRFLPLIPIYIIAVPLFLFFIFVVEPIHMLRGFFINLSVWMKWCRQGKYVLFVYSNSPNWQNYIEEKFLPQIKDHSIILNWSERRTWPRDFALEVYKYYHGRYQYNPMAVVFQPFIKTKVFRFFKPFHKHKKGHPEDLEKMEKDFIETVQKITVRK